MNREEAEKDLSFSSMENKQKIFDGLESLLQKGADNLSSEALEKDLDLVLALYNHLPLTANWCKEIYIFLYILDGNRYGEKTEDIIDSLKIVAPLFKEHKTLQDFSENALFLWVTLLRGILEKEAWTRHITRGDIFLENVAEKMREDVGIPKTPCILMDVAENQLASQSLRWQKQYPVKDLPFIQYNEERVFFSSHPSIISYEETGFLGKKISINPVELGYIDFLWAENDVEIESIEMSAYSVDDGEAYTGKFHKIYAGYVDTLYVYFQKDVPEAIKNFKMASFIEGIYINGKKIHLLTHRWFTDLSMEIKIDPQEIHQGDEMEMKFLPVATALKFASVRSTDILADKFPPMGKIALPAIGPLETITIYFNKIMDLALREMKNPETFIEGAHILSGPHEMKEPREINLLDATGKWFLEDGKSTLMLELGRDETIAEGEFIQISYKDIVTDQHGNQIKTIPTMIPIGASIPIDDDRGQVDKHALYTEIYASMGGRTPFMVVAGSSAGNSKVARKNYLSDSGLVGGPLPKQIYWENFSPLG